MTNHLYDSDNLDVLHADNGATAAGMHQMDGFCADVAPPDRLHRSGTGPACRRCMPRRSGKPRARKTAPGRRALHMTGIPTPPRGLICGPNRSDDFKAGHRMAVRAAVAWLHAEAERMNDPKARAVLDLAASDLGVMARRSKETSRRE